MKLLLQNILPCSIILIILNHNNDLIVIEAHKKANFVGERIYILVNDDDTLSACNWVIK